MLSGPSMLALGEGFGKCLEKISPLRSDTVLNMPTNKTLMIWNPAPLHAGSSDDLNMTWVIQNGLFNFEGTAQF